MKLPDNIIMYCDIMVCVHRNMITHCNITMGTIAISWPTLRSWCVLKHKSSANFMISTKSSAKNVISTKSSTNKLIYTKSGANYMISTKSSANNVISTKAVSTMWSLPKVVPTNWSLPKVVPTIWSPQKVVPKYDLLVEITYKQAIIWHNNDLLMIIF